jgi:hypothetical protein
MRFWLALFVSLLAHGLFYAWLLQQQPKPTRATAVKPAPLQVVLIRTPNRQQADKASKAATPSAVATPVATPTTSSQPSATPTKVARSQSRAQKSKATVTAKTTTATATATSPAAVAIPAADFTSILEQAKNRAQQRPLSSAELQALTENTIGHPDPHLPKEPQQQNPAHLAKDVLIAFDNGNQLVKVGKDRCVLVIQGADLQKDIQSMKLAPCGKDKNAALFERIMSEIGQNRAAGDN